MVAFTGHPNALLKLNKAFWEAATLKGVLVNGWTPDVDANTEYSDVSAFEVSMTGYTVGGVTLGSKLVDLDTDGKAHYRAAHATWVALGPGTVSHFVLCADDGVNNWIVGHANISALQPDGGQYQVRASNDGWLTDEWGV